VHELSIVRSLCGQAARVARLHRARAIRSLALEVGPLSGVVPDLLESAFDAYRVTEPMCRDATLEIRRTPLAVRCDACAAETEIESFRFRCPACEDPRVRVVRGEELLLRDLVLEVDPEVEDAPDPTGARDGEPAGEQRLDRAGAP
jgi:hydrogenase nickel incorporation protein HypA/HybF